MVENISEKVKSFERRLIPIENFNSGILAPFPKSLEPAVRVISTFGSYQDLIDSVKSLEPDLNRTRSFSNASSLTLKKKKKFNFNNKCWHHWLPNLVISSLASCNTPHSPGPRQSLNLWGKRDHHLERNWLKLNSMPMPSHTATCHKQAPVVVTVEPANLISTFYLP